MSEEKALALWLAELLEADPNSKAHHDQAAAELRRLHAAHDWQYRMAGDRLRRIEKLEAVNAELLEACKEAEWNSLHLPESVRIKLKAAIKKAERV